MTNDAQLREKLKQLIIESLNLEGLTPESLDDDAPLFGQGLGLDSVDALELVVVLEREYGIKILSHQLDKRVFTSVSTMATFVTQTLEAATDDRSGKA